MPTLASDLRNRLERVVIEARDVAEAGARTALEALAVHHHEPYPHMKPAQRELRNHLRARARQLGDIQDRSGLLALDHLVNECAYEHWHRMLFARFLAENGLLIEPQENMAISLAEAEELAREEGLDVWTFASHCAQGMLPQVFRPEDPLLQVTFATEHWIKLERLLGSLPQAAFTASDALGWVYQFWQSKKKDEVNRSEVKIGADELPAVTQLFTEPYMVEFLLHNTLGAWWAGKNLTAVDGERAQTEQELRNKLALPGVTWDYLRFVRGEDGKQCPWRPAAGTFDGWPKTATELKVLDPCCGSGHFLVAALRHLVPIRMAEEGLSAAEAVDAVLRDNLHGLEIDERCCQIAAFALALAAWTCPGAGGYRPLPELHIACTGIGPQSSAEEWVKLAEQSGMPIRPDERARIKNGLLNLHRLFSQAPTLGSLINPAELPGGLFSADYETIQPYLEAIMSAEKADDETRERAIAAAGMVKAADLLAGRYALVITNVPYLKGDKQAPVLRDFSKENHPDAKACLSTTFLDRILDWPSGRGTVAVVMPQYVLFLGSYAKFRQRLLQDREFELIARLGPNAFETISGEMVNVALLVLSKFGPRIHHRIPAIDLLDVASASGKRGALREPSRPLLSIGQAEQERHPDARVVLDPAGLAQHPPVSDVADFGKGSVTGDSPHYLRSFWELSHRGKGCCLWQNSSDSTSPWSGRSNIALWDVGGHNPRNEPGCWIRGQRVWKRRGVAITKMSSMLPSFYEGEIFDDNCAVLAPFEENNLPAIWAFCESPSFAEELRKLDSKVSVTAGTFAKLPFDLAHWQKVATERYPNGLPHPESGDPTQWLFHGRPEESIAPLQVAVARMLGYRWLAELDDKMRLSSRARALAQLCGELARFADDDGIICIPSVRGEEPAAERLLALLNACGLKPEKVRELTGGSDLDDWLRSSFFEEHCRLFHDRPFAWHIWDGRKRDGFHALVNYHKLCEGGGKGRKLLESLTYSYLGEWITRQKDGVKRGEGGAEDRLAAAVELQKRLRAILEGEPPFDIFVRWKPLSEQPIGWEPDINDGVRINIRPFLASDLPAGRTGAGVLRYKPNIKWEKDRGKEPDRPRAEYPWFWGCNETTDDFMGGKEFDGNRWNACHYTNKAKQAARDVAKGARRA